MGFATIDLIFLFALLTGARTSPADKIIGGENANIKDYPYQVSLRKNGHHFCGGAIISERHILTAAHCVKGTIIFPYSDVLVVTASSLSYGTTGKGYRIKRAHINPDYADDISSSYHNDLAILTLSSIIRFDSLQSKISLPTRDVSFGDNAVVTGWGIKKYPSNYVSPTLQVAAMSIIPARKCAKYFDSLNLYNEQVCALQRKGVGICSGDSGGPLVVDREVVGIASWVVPCAEGYPDVYTKVYAYKNWIQKVLSVI